MAGLESHLKDTAQYIALSEAVVDVFKIARHPAFKRIFIQKFGEPAYRSIRRHLADIGMPDAGGLEWTDKALNWMRGAATAWGLGLNLGTAVKQANAVFNYGSDEGFSTAALGMKAVMNKGVAQSVKEMKDLSPVVAERWQAADREISDSLRSVSWTSNPKLTAVRQAMFYPIQVADRMTVLPMWWGSYTKRIQDGMEPAAAALAADKAITSTVPGAPRALDMSAISRDKRGWMRLLTSFSTFTLHWGNRQRFYIAGLRSGQVPPGEFLYHVAVEGVAAPLGTLALMGLLWGNFPPEDEEKKKAMIQQYGLELLTYQFAGLPGLKELVTGATAEGRNRSFGDALPAFGMFNMLIRSGDTFSKLAEDMSDPKREWAALKAVADLISYSARIPASKVLERIHEGWRQLDSFEDDDSALKWLNEVFTVLIPDPKKRKETF
jgi:hypothetical protein